MSADNYYVIKRHPNGGYAAVMGFASDDRALVVRPERHRSFETVIEALTWAWGEYSEYGVSLDPEVQAEMAH